MSPIDYLRDMAARRRRRPLGAPTQADMDRLSLVIERARAVQDAIESLAPGVTVAEASANVAALTRAFRRGDPLVACGCWPRYVGDCRCRPAA